MPLQTIRARYANGVLTPLEPLDLSEGCEVTIDVGTDAATSPVRVGSPRLLEIVDAVNLEFPDAFADMPHDGAQHYKHYLYGHAKDGD